MFNRKGDGRFLGRDNVPDDPPDTIRADSPKHHGNRNDYASQRDDQLLRRLRAKQIVRDPNGTEFTIPGHAPLKEGWRRIGVEDPANKPTTHELWKVPAKYVGSCELTASTTMRLPNAQRKLAESKGWQYLGPCMRGREPIADIDKRHGLGDGITMSEREHLATQLDAHAHEVRVAPYRTGRYLNLISEGEGIVPEYADDSSIGQRVHKRGEMPKVHEKKDGEP